jgi:hypothetical protein
MKILKISFWSAISCAYAPGYFQTSISFALFDLSNRRSSKNWSLSAVLFWQISATICVCLSIAFFLSSFDHRTFEEVAKVVYALYVVCLSLKLNQKGRFTIMFILMLLIELCEVLYEGSFQLWGMESDEMRWSMEKSSSLGMPMSPQEISNSYKHQSLGMPPRHPFFICKN